MSWIAPNAADVLSELTPAEGVKYQSILGGASQGEKIVPILDRVVAEIRGYIISGGYSVDPDTSMLPPSLISDAVVIARWRYLTSVPDLDAVQSDNRKAAFDAAMAKLMLIASGDWAIEPPEPLTGSAIFGSWNSENKLIMRTHPVASPASQTGAIIDTGYANPP